MSTENSADEEGSGIRSPASGTPFHSFGRRRFLTECVFGLGAMALTDLLGQEGLLANPAKPSFEPAFARGGLRDFDGLGCINVAVAERT